MEGIFNVGWEDGWVLIVESEIENEEIGESGV